MVGVKRISEGVLVKINPNKFFKLILPLILDQKMLSVPETSAKEFTPQLPTYKTLTVRTGVSWKILLEKIGNKLYFTEGWAKFMEHNDIKYGYFLEFEYEGDNNYKVHIFDLSCSEIDYPVDYDENEHVKQEIAHHDAKVMEVIEIEEDEGEKASPSFTIVVGKCNISSNSSGCFFRIPKKFSNKHMEGNLPKIITLQVDDGREWSINCNHSHHDIRLVGSVWKNFKLENNWKEGETYTFVLVSKKRYSVTFKVSKV